MQTNIISHEVAKRIEARTNIIEKEKVETLIDLRTEFKKNEEALRAEKVIIEFYKEAAPLMRMDYKTVQDSLGVIREYPDQKLRYWITTSKLGFNHIKMANRYGDVEGTKFYQNPSGLLDAAIEYGSKKGNRPMTVDEMIEFTTGEKRKMIFSFMATVQQIFGRLISEIPIEWSKDDRQALEAYLADVQSEIRDRFFSEGLKEEGLTELNLLG